MNTIVAGLNLAKAIQRDANAILNEREFDDACTGEAQRAQLHIEDEDSADWLLRQYAQIDSEIALLQAQHEARVKRLQSERTRLENLYQSELEQYARQALAGGKRKSVILAHGTLAFRTVKGGLKLTNRYDAIQYALLRNRDDVTRRELDGEAYRKWAEAEAAATGELLPGMEVTDARESFSVQFPKPGKATQGEEE